MIHSHSDGRDNKLPNTNKSLNPETVLEEEKRESAENHLTKVGVATGLLPELAFEVCSFILDDSAPELAFMSIREIVESLRTWNGESRWYSKPQFIEMIDLNEKLSMILRAIEDLRASTASEPETKIEKEEDEEDRQHAPSSLEKIFLSLYEQYEALLPRNEHGRLTPEFVQKQKNRIKAYVDKFRSDYSDIALALTHFSAGDLTTNKDTLENLKATRMYGSAVLICAASHGHTKVVNLLLQVVLDAATRLEMLKPADQYSYIALVFAAEGGHTEMLNLLLRVAPDAATRLEMLKPVDQFGKTALICAASNGHIEVAKLLLQTAPDDATRLEMLKAVDQSGKTALIYAASHGHTKVVHLLKENEERISGELKEERKATAHPSSASTESSFFRELASQQSRRLVTPHPDSGTDTTISQEITTTPRR